MSIKPSVTTPASAAHVGKQADNAWSVLFLLFLVNLLNFFDRTIPAVVLEPMRLEFELNDLQLGIVGAAFTVVYAIAGIPLGRMSDTGSRKKVLALGLSIWSGLTAATGMATSYMTLLLARMGVGVGEASCAPAATSLIGDLFPANKRSRAMGVFMLGLPLGLVLAFFTVGAMVKAFDSWRAPFFIAAIPGLLLAAVILFMREPARGAAEDTALGQNVLDRPLRRVLSIPTMWWIILSGVAVNFAAYAGNGYLVALLQRYYDLPIDQAAMLTGLIVGVTGLIGLTIGGQLSDRIHMRSQTGRLNYGALCMVIAAVATGFALDGDNGVMAFSILFGIGWLTYYSYYTTVYPALQDVVEPRLRATAMALYFAGMYLLGGAFGLVVVGGLSDYLANEAMVAAGALEMTEAFRAIGLHDAMYLVPVTLGITAVFVFLAGRSFRKDHLRMLDQMAH
ncbi:spinster family MFS transporter [Allohahella sp. A8]|uniref:spinster family MFS transporter n=1 Tax=Allohahella sp. A8 TaxID=3141461 RepID=UPI002688156E